MLLRDRVIIAADADGVAVMRSIDLARAGVPGAVRVLFWVFHRFGRPVGPVPMDELKRLADRDDRSVARPSLP